MINATTAWLYGCSAANSTLLGLGERTGNPPIEGLIFEYIALKGNNGIDTTVITDIAEYFEKEIGVKIPHNFPLSVWGSMSPAQEFTPTASLNAKKFIIYSIPEKF
jgi:isopropylmalate/homocitrate/citramalate synthase